MSMKMNIQGGGSIGGRPTDNKSAPKSLWSSTKRLMGYMRQSRLLILLTLGTAIGGTLMQVFTPKLLGGATTIIFEGIKGRSGIDFSALLSVLTVVSMLYLGVFLSAFLQERMMTAVSLKTTETLRNAVKAKLNRVPVAYFDSQSTGDLMSVAINDIDNIAQSLQQSLTQLISSIILVVGTLAIMLTINPLLTLLACIVIPASLLVAKIFTPIAQKHNKKYYASMGTMGGSIEETYQNFTIIKSFSAEQDALKKFQKSNDELCESGWQARFYGGGMMHIMMLIQNMAYVLIAGLGALRVLSGTLTIGDLQAFLQYSQQFSSPVSKLSTIWGSLLSAIASAERVFRLLDAQEMDQSEQRHGPYIDNAKVVFDNISFGYGDSPLMESFNLEVANGQTVAIVGHIGAGKTTMVNLLERFYEIQGGSIRIDGVDIRDIDRQQLRRRMGMVLQDTWLFSGTILENIRFGNPHATDEQVRTAAAAAYAADFINKLPNGFDTRLGEDTDTISQGQRQLITIARALLADPEILILDEATSNVDSRTEMIVQKAMKKLMEGRTSFVIAHRLSTIYDADRIIVMENGDIVETGTHSELLESAGAYADIYNSQFRHAAA